MKDLNSLISGLARTKTKIRQDLDPKIAVRWAKNEIGLAQLSEALYGARTSNGAVYGWLAQSFRQGIRDGTIKVKV